MGWTKIMINNYYIKYVVLVISILLSIMVALLIVTLPAPFTLLALGENASSIGGAIGGIGAVVVGIANVIMLYVTFRNQYKVNKQQQQQIVEQQNVLIAQQTWFANLNKKIDEENKERIADKKHAQFLELRKQFGKIKQSWFSNKLITANQKTYLGVDAINQYILLYNCNKTTEMLNCKTFEAEIFIIYHELHDYILEIRNVREQKYKIQLMNQTKLFYEHSMQIPCRDIYSFVNDKDKWIIIKGDIEVMLK